jgi:hypothetical protein
VIFPLSRLVGDVGRIIVDENEPMAVRGMGVIYTRTSMGGPLRDQPKFFNARRLSEKACRDSAPWPE